MDTTWWRARPQPAQPLPSLQQLHHLLHRHVPRARHREVLYWDTRVRGRNRQRGSLQRQCAASAESSSPLRVLNVFSQKKNDELDGM